MSTPLDIPPEEDLKARALELLEFPQVLERLAGHAQFPLARELALSLTPAYSQQEVLRLQQETTEAVRFLAKGQDLDMRYAKDVRQAVGRAALGGILQGAELREVHDTLKMARGVRTALASRKDLAILSSMAKQIPNLRDPESQIAAAIGREGEVLDKASPQLGELLREARSAYERLMDFLQRAMRRLQLKGVLQEPLVTERHGRMVLLVKVEMRQQVQGIVHDVSDSGATFFVEPLPAVSLGNHWRELRLAAEREEQRILQALSGAVGSRNDDLLLALDLLARIDLALAKARYAASIDGVPVALVQTDRPYLRLVDAHHPLLPGRVVPNTVELGDLWSLMLITGPNAGGKTVALKMIGLLSLMAQAGLHVPAREAAMSVFDGFYADIGDQQSIQRSLSTFSSHVHNLRSILERATPLSLALIDELGTSTDPEEGAALAKALLLEFHRRRIPLVATSHHRNVAAFVQENPGMVNASVELHPETLAPTYRLTVGLPGRSYALTVASRLGVPPEVIDGANSLLSDSYREAESLLKDLQQERHRAEEKRMEAELESSEAQKLRHELEERLAALEQEKDRLLEEARRDLQARVEEMWRRLRAAERAMEAPAPLHTTSVVNVQKQEVAALRRELKSPSWRPKTADRRWIKELKPGDMVYLRGIPQPVEVLTGPGDSDVLEVALGSMRARVPLEEVERKAEADVPAPPATPIRRTTSKAAPAKGELDLRGMRVEEALEQIDRSLDRATLEGLSSVRIVHGVGTGALRNALREYLAKHPLVKSAAPEQGRNTDGATVVELV